MGIAGRIYEKFRARPWLGYVLVFSLTLAIYGLTQAYPSMRDPDSFYHAKMAVLTMEQGPVRDFPWLPFTVLADDFADHQFLYHVLLIPFISIWGPLAGVKAAAALFGAFAVLAIYWLMRVMDVRFPAVFALLLATTDNFMFRMNLAKTSSLSVIILTLGIIAMLKRRPWMLAPLSFVYVWMYAGWPLLPVLAAVFLVSAYVVRFVGRKWGGRFVAPGDGFTVVGLKSVGATAVGSLAGLMVNPFFPSNIRFYLAQIGHIALINYREVIDVGVEWYPYGFADLVGQNGLLFYVFVAAVALAICAVVWSKEAGSRLRPFDRREGTALVMMAALASVFLVLTLKSCRHVEYFMPFMMLLNAALFSAVLTRTDFRRLWDAIFGRFVLLPKLLAVLFFIFVPLLAVRDMNAVIDDHGRGIPWNRFKGVTDWMDGRVPDGATVFHTNWGDFPELFYYADGYRYISGLDPTFMYLRDKETYAVYRDVKDGVYGDRTGQIVRDAFGADHLLIRNGLDDKLEGALDSDPTMERVYEDDVLILYSGL